MVRFAGEVPLELLGFRLEGHMRAGEGLYKKESLRV